MNFTIRPWNLAAAVAVLTVGCQMATAAGVILITDTASGSATVATYSPLSGYGTQNDCGTDAGAYDYCNLVYFLAPTFSGAATKLQLVNDATGQSTTIAYSNLPGTYEFDEYADADNSLLPGAILNFYGGGPVDGSPELYVSFSDFQSYSYINSYPCNGGCVGSVTGAVQDGFTVNYENSSGTVLGTDVIEFEGQTPPTPEPASFLLLLSGLGMAAAGKARKLSRR